ncbi:hypothetical protein DSOL_2836 [Desulfosporosinus metallidurans]|uniref:Uncharacterized protein n=1 Tax=Desulfosporosinus metallidurans TaxID=1888891 RepID=A0A1Q8QUB8_9FIRM|nr:hypothetical protein DSOL_2836 [Desulfosporosinus metallidurans]
MLYNSVTREALLLLTQESFVAVDKIVPKFEEDSWRTL